MTNNMFNTYWENYFQNRTHYQIPKYPTTDLVRIVSHTFKDLKPNATALDIGSGFGSNAAFLATYGYHVTALDCSPTAIDRAKLAIQESRYMQKPSKHINFLHSDLTSIPLPDSSIDLAVDFVCLYSLPLSDLSIALSEVCRVLKPGGHFCTQFFGPQTTGLQPQPNTELPYSVHDVSSGPCITNPVVTVFDLNSYLDFTSDYFSHVTSFDTTTTHFKQNEHQTTQHLTVLLHK